MKTLAELTATDAPAIALIRQWAATAAVPIELLPPSALRGKILEQLQVSTHSTLGAVAYETGGVLIDHGWLRLLGSGHERLIRTLPGWNEGRAQGLYLVADDAAGGFFALNGGALGEDRGNVYYFAPDSLRWEPLGCGYSQFVQWAMSPQFSGFAADLRWSCWENDVRALQADRCFSWYPPLFAKSDGSRHRGEIPVAEAWGMQQDFKAQLGGEKTGNR